MLSTRLTSLKKYIDKSDSVIDIGCDHALLDIELIKDNILDSIIVSDINKGALKQGEKNIKTNKLEGRIDFRLGNGLKVLTDEDKVDTILISGMGTNTILEILNNDYLKNINKLVLQSNNDHYELRKNVIALGFYIEAEEYFVDNKKNYINIVFKRGNKKYKKNELKYGPFLIKNSEYLCFELSNCVKIYNLLPDNKMMLKHALKKEIKLLNKLIKKTSK